jgi:hypothetical protein
VSGRANGKSGRDGAVRRARRPWIRRADLLAILGIFGRLKNERLDVVSIIGREQMRESSFLQELADETRLEMAREDVLDVLRARFGETAAEEFQQTVTAITHLDQLKALLKLAAKSRRISQFRRGMPGT